MTPAVRLWQELVAQGVQLSATGEGDIRYSGPKRALTWERKLLLQQFKKEVLELLRSQTCDAAVLDSMAYKCGWLILCSGQAYSRQLTPTLTVFLLRDDGDKWRVWKGYWRRGKSVPFHEDTLVDGLLFDDALMRGNDYIRWHQERNEIRC